MQISLRINTHDIKQVKEIIGGATRYMYAFEGDGQKIKYHTHLYWVEEERKLARIRLDIKKLDYYKETDEIKKRAAYSLKEIKGDDTEVQIMKYIAYMMKGGKYEYQGINDEEMEEAKEYDDKLKEESNKPQWKKDMDVLVHQNTTIVKQIQEIPYDKIDAKEYKQAIMFVMGELINIRNDNEKILKGNDLKNISETILLNININYKREYIKHQLKFY